MLLNVKKSQFNIKSFQLRVTFVLSYCFIIMTTAIYLNFNGNAETAFHYYRDVFNGKFIGEISRFGDQNPVGLHYPERIKHVELLLPDKMLLVGSDLPENWPYPFQIGTNVFVQLKPINKIQAIEWFEKLSSNGRIFQKMQMASWGSYYGSCRDAFGCCWMIDLPMPKHESVKVNIHGTAHNSLAS
jgi:PhnB protein